MYEATFDLEAITPIFMRGADQTKAEIRASSIKGLMRWWFRALAGNYFGNDVAGLKKAEEYVFGSTKRRSRVVVEVTDVAGEKRRIIFRYGNPCIVDRHSPSNELKYLWFSINLLARKCNFDEYYPEGTKFTLKIKAVDQRSFKIALVSLWALVSLGSIGFRGRRGAGSVRFYDGDLHEFDSLGLRWKFRKKDEIKKSIERAIRCIGDRIERSTVETVPTHYPILSERTSVVAIWDAKTGKSICALNMLQKEYQMFRKCTHQSDRIVFGLPINLRGRGTNAIRDMLYAIRNSRRSSPMIVGIVTINERLYIRIVKFRTEPYHPISDLNDLANWAVIKEFNEKLGEYIVFGNLEVFK